ncbi:hypothetical protein KBD87_02625 [Candidatus Saccharibacteria bacterium]|mgnify:CR=1 FL=1|nr:hypothetical protein [Candidatus Saccharibacteria bacterium]
MIQQLKHIVLAAGLVIAGITVLMPHTSAAALDPKDGINQGIDSAGGEDTKSTDLNEKIKQIVNVLMFIMGAISVIMVVVGGIRYAVSGGDQTSITAGKNTVLYAIIGLVVAIMGYAIVNWIVDAFSK